VAVLAAEDTDASVQDALVDRQLVDGPDDPFAFALRLLPVVGQSAANRLQFLVIDGLVLLVRHFA
jgi:hypothetical protein